MKKTNFVVAKAPDALAQTLGLSGSESQEWQVQHALLRKLRLIVKAESITHAEVAQRGGSSRTRVTAILNGNLDHVSTDILIRLLRGLGYRVKVSVSRIDAAA
jgi:predicted XRE-type DNA-binding protein